MAQTNVEDYGFALDRAQVGQKAGMDFDQVESRAAEGTVPFGSGVIFGTDPEKQVAVPADATGDFAGIALFTHKQAQVIDVAAAFMGAEYRDKDTVNVLRRGRVWVEATAEVAAGDAAYVDVATEGEEGKFTNVAAVGETPAIPNLATGGVFRSSGDVGDLVIVEINLP
jgi:hypothetical protein